MNKEEYLSLMLQEYFYICNNKHVVEIGPSDHMIHTNIILKNNVKLLEVIEPYPHIPNLLRSTSITVIQDDVFKVLNFPHPADIVICLGVLYHLHSPLHLLELIANNANPDYVILDSVNSGEYITFLEENDNIFGNRQTINGWKSCKYKCTAPFNIINSSMINLGYTLDKTHKLTVEDYFPKSNSWVGLWSKNK